MPYLKGNKGLNWHYELEGDGPPLLFLHGWGVDMRIWRQQVKHFASKYRTVSIDFPGHGRSSWVSITLDDLAYGVCEILDFLKMENIDVVCSSFGGQVALRLFKKSPDKIKRLVLVGSSPKLVNTNGYSLGLPEDHVKKLSRQLESDYPAIVNIFFRSLFTIDERQGRRFKWLQIFRQNISLPQKQALFNFLEIMRDSDVRDTLHSLSIPLQIVSGTDDYICRREAVEYMAGMLPEANIHFFAKCGHFPFLTEPHEFNRVVEGFLKS